MKLHAAWKVAVVGLVISGGAGGGMAACSDQAVSATPTTYWTFSKDQVAVGESLTVCVEVEGAEGLSAELAVNACPAAGHGATIGAWALISPNACRAGTSGGSGRTFTMTWSEPGTHTLTCAARENMVQPPAKTIVVTGGPADAGPDAPSVDAGPDAPSVDAGPDAPADAADAGCVPNGKPPGGDGPCEGQKAVCCAKSCSAELCGPARDSAPPM